MVSITCSSRGDRPVPARADGQRTKRVRKERKRAGRERAPGAWRRRQARGERADLCGCRPRAHCRSPARSGGTGSLQSHYRCALGASCASGCPHTSSSCRSCCQSARARRPRPRRSRRRSRAQTAQPGMACSFSPAPPLPAALPAEVPFVAFDGLFCNGDNDEMKKLLQVRLARPACSFPPAPPKRRATVFAQARACGPLVARRV